MKTLIQFLLAAFMLGCSKHNGIENLGGSFRQYTIQAGAHYADEHTITKVSGTRMQFTVKFDSSAIYPSPVTDYDHARDINKLYGFSEGHDNQLNSARIGWRWLNNQLQLLAYVHLDGKVYRNPVSQEVPLIKVVKIHTEINCSIAVSGFNYLFTVDEATVTTPRATDSPLFNGLQQYPYFGGALVAPQKITIQIK